MRRLPRIGEEIFDTGELLTPENFPQAWDATLDELEDAIGGGAGRSGSGLASFLGNGRVISTAVPEDDGDRFLPSSPSLSLKLPEGERFVIGGNLYEVDEDVAITGLPAAFTGWGILGASEDVDSGIVTWTLSGYNATRPALGSGAIKIVTDSDSLTTVDISEANSDVIPELPYLLQIIASSGGGGGGGGYNDTALKNAIAIMNGRITALENTAAEGTPVVLNETENIHSILAGHDMSLSEVNPLHPNYMDGSMLWDGLTGNGENRPPDEQQPDVNAGGNEPRGDE